MTDYVVRIKRDGRFELLDIDELTDAELDEFFAQFDDPTLLANWAKSLARWIRDHVSGQQPGLSEPRPN